MLCKRLKLPGCSCLAPPMLGTRPLPRDPAARTPAGPTLSHEPSNNGLKGTLKSVSMIAAFPSQHHALDVPFRGPIATYAQTELEFAPLHLSVGNDKAAQPLVTPTPTAAPLSDEQQDSGGDGLEEGLLPRLTRVLIRGAAPTPSPLSSDTRSIAAPRFGLVCPVSLSVELQGLAPHWSELQISSLGQHVRISCHPHRRATAPSQHQPYTGNTLPIRMPLVFSAFCSVTIRRTPATKPAMGSRIRRSRSPVPSVTCCVVHSQACAIAVPQATIAQRRRWLGNQRWCARALAWVDGTCWYALRRTNVYSPSRLRACCSSRMELCIASQVCQP